MEQTVGPRENSSPAWFRGSPVSPYPVSVSVVFRCDHCGATPDPETRARLEAQLLDLRHGPYVDAEAVAG